jgi:cyclopropane-fatty-acyl-phospholipid synthase
VLDIGCGWGGLGIYLAQVAQVDVTGITLSREQLNVASSRAARTGLAGRMHFHPRNCREEQGQYDRVASVGMFEHVGTPHYGEFFRKLRDLLKPDGVVLMSGSTRAT